ncbi:MAG TPA: alpha/beta hydrolase [Pseudonocardia sp.]|nr:alpha/beta hydrolase [Pseudonocardia sp.]
MSQPDQPARPGADAPVHRGGSGSPLVLLHGMNMSWRAWRPVLALLEPYHELHVPTLPGHRGGRPMHPGGITVEALADRLCEQLDEAGLDTFHVAGNSLGGWLSLELARRGRARSVVALSPAGAWTSMRDVRRLIRRFRLGLAIGNRPTLARMTERPRVRRMMLRQVAEHPERFTEAQVAEMFEDAAGCTVVGELLERVRDGGSFKAFDELPCPVRLAWSEHDRTIPFRRYGRPMLDSLPGAEFVELPGVGHVPMIDDPALVSRTILQLTWSVDEREASGAA